jgi:hypothetical protein
LVFSNENAGKRKALKIIFCAKSPGAALGCVLAFKRLRKGEKNTKGKPLTKEITPRLNT